MNLQAWKHDMHQLIAAAAAAAVTVKKVNHKEKFRKRFVELVQEREGESENNAKLASNVLLRMGDKNAKVTCFILFLLLLSLESISSGYIYWLVEFISFSVAHLYHETKKIFMIFGLVHDYVYI